RVPVLWVHGVHVLDLHAPHVRRDHRLPRAFAVRTDDPVHADIRPGQSRRPPGRAPAGAQGRAARDAAQGGVAGEKSQRGAAAEDAGPGRRGREEADRSARGAPPAPLRAAEQRAGQVSAAATAKSRARPRTTLLAARIRANPRLTLIPFSALSEAERA